MKRDRWGIPGVLYLLHFAEALGDPSRPHMSAQHYLGWAERGQGLANRIELHRKGQSGVALVRAFYDAGIPFSITWERFGTRYDERRLKKAGHFADRLCCACRLAKLNIHQQYDIISIGDPK